MKFAVGLSLLLVAFLHKVQADAEACDSSKCDIAENCRCSTTNGPLSLEETPQLIVLAFTDAATDDIYKNRWSSLVEPRLNPDGKYSSATFFINHEYSNYQIVHDLASYGFEIAVHSVTNNVNQSYWRNADQELLEKEFGNQRTIISKFANIPEENIIGTITPQLQLAGDSSLRAFTAQGFTYDNSWPSKLPYYPYTLDYASTQDCDIGAKCPTESYKGFWIAPIVDLISEDGDVCNTLAGCFRSRNNQTAEEISDWIVQQVETVKSSNKAPLTLIIEENLFTSVEGSWDGLNDGLNRIQEAKDVFLVSQSRVIEWIKNPVPLSEFTTSAVEIDLGCVKTSCNLQNLEGQSRLMVSCVPCPKNYPWLDNPEGN